MFVTTLHLGLSYACNMHCEHCYVNRKKDRLDFERIQVIIDELYEQGLAIVYYTYGEPLLAKHFFDVARYVAEKGLVQILMTNGSLLTRDAVESIKAIGISNVYVSIDSADSREHDNNRGFDGAYDAALKGIRLLKEYDIHVGISSTVTPKNVLQLKDIYDLAIKENVRIVSFLRARVDGTVISLSEEARKAYIKFFRFGIEQKDINLKFHDPELLSVLKLWHEAGEIGDVVYEKYNGMNNCHKQSTVSVAPDGTVCRCNLIGDLLGNVFDMSISNILLEEKNADIVCKFSVSK